MGWGTRSAGILLGCLLAPLAQAQVDLEPFLKQDVLETLKISPTGEYYALTVPLEDQTILAVQRRSDRQITAKISAGADSIIDDVWWVSDDRVVVSVAKKYGSRDRPMRPANCMRRTWTARCAGRSSGAMDWMATTRCRVRPSWSTRCRTIRARC